MEIIGIILGILGLIGTIAFGLRSRTVGNAFARYVQLEGEVNRLRGETSNNIKKIHDLESVKNDIYRHKYQPKTKAFVPGDRVKLIRKPEDRYWISDNSKLGMTGIVVDYGPGLYEYTV